MGYCEDQEKYREWLHQKQAHHAHIRRILLAWVLVNTALIVGLVAGVIAYYTAIWLYSR